VPTNLTAILRLEVPVIVEIGQRAMPLTEVLGLTPGAIVELSKAADEELDILVNNKRIGTGTAVKVGENFGIRVRYVGDVKDRLKAMRGDRAPDPLNDDSVAGLTAQLLTAV